MCAVSLSRRLGSAETDQLLWYCVIQEARPVATRDMLEHVVADYVIAGCFVAHDHGVAIDFGRGEIGAR